MTDDLMLFKYIVAPDLASIEGYRRRGGYDASFLGGGDQTVALPVIPAALAAQLVAVDTAAAGSQRFALPYEHFSIVVHVGRRMALFTAGNIDGANAQPIKRAGDPWARDPRLPRDTQWAEELYKGKAGGQTVWRWRAEVQEEFARRADWMKDPAR